MLESFGTHFRKRFGTPHTAILTDSRVHRLYGRALVESLAEQGITASMIVVPEGERSKSIEQYVHVLEQLTATGFDRRGVLVNLGGGMVCDLGGFVASSYMRGVRYVNFGTSTTSQIDASVGGKVAINNAHAKNVIGAFHHPSYVVGDPGLTRTLSERDYKSGIAEAIKMGIIASPELFGILVEQADAIRARDAIQLQRITSLSASLKMDIVGLDPYEEDLRRPLNFGHTLGHPIETEFSYENVRHGEAVAVGMGVATLISLEHGQITEPLAQSIFDLLQAYDLFGCTPAIHVDKVIEHLRLVRMIRAGRLHFVIPETIGRVCITEEISNSDLIRAFETYEQLCVARGCR